MSRHKVLNTIWNPYFLFFLLLVVGWFSVHTLRGKIWIRTDCLSERYYPWKNWFSSDSADITPGPCDAVEDTYPQRNFTVDQLLKGKIPLWNPYIFSGTPHLAHPFNSLFSPFILLFLFLPMPFAYGIATVLALLLGCFFMALFLKELKCSSFASTCGAILFGFSGLVVNEPNEQSEWITILWFPLLLFAMTRYQTRFQFRYLVLASLTIGLSLFGGMPEYLLWILMFAGAYFIFLATPHFSKLGVYRGLLRHGFFLFLIVCLGVQLGAVQLLPSLELTRLGVRSILPFHVVSFVKPYSLLELVFPVEPLPRPLVSPLQFYNTILFIGLFPLAIILYLLLDSFTKSTDRNPSVIFFLVSTILTLLMLLGIPGFDRLYHLLVPISRRVHRLLLLFHFSVATLTALGITKIEQGVKGSRSASRVTRILFCMAFVALGVILLLFGASYVLSFEGTQHLFVVRLAEAYRKIFNPNVHMDFAVLHGKLLFSEFARRWNILTPYSMIHWLPVYMGLVGLGAFWGILKSNSKFFKRAWRLLLIVSILVPPLHFMNRGKQFGDPAMLFPSSESIAFLKEKGPPHTFRVIGLDRAFSNNFPMAFGLQTVGGYNALFPRRLFQVMSLLEPTLEEGRRQGFSGEISLYEKTTELRSPILDMLNVRYIVARETADLRRWGLKLRFHSEKDGMTIWENENALPRAFFVSHAVEAQGRELALLQEKEFDPSKLLVLSEPFEEKGSIQQEEGGRPSVEMISYEPDDVRLQVSNPKKGFLVLADAYYPGWRAAMDGRETKIYIANYLLRAVRLSPGTHDVRFYYDPLSFKIGALLTLSYPFSLFLCYLLIHKSQRIKGILRL